MEENESLNKEVRSSRDDTMRPQTLLQKPFTNLYLNDTTPFQTRQNCEIGEDNCEDKYVNVVKDDEAEDIYEVIPADFIPSTCVQKNMVHSPSLSSLESGCSEHSSRRASSCGLPHCSQVTPGSSPKTNGFCYPPDSQYAEIFHSPKITEIIPSRPTRESVNPILRQDFAQLTENYGSTTPEMKNIRDTLAWLSKTKAKSKPAKTKKSFSPFNLKRSLSSGDAQNGGHSNGPGVLLYGNSPMITPEPSPSQSPRLPKSPVYENIEFPFMESDRESQISSSTSSTEERTEETNLYENIDNFATENQRRTRTKSNPIDIVYSDLQFPNDKVEAYLSSSLSTSSSLSHKELDHRSRSLTPNCTCTPPLPRGNGLARPKSLSLKRLASGSLGIHLARFVKSVPVQRSNDKTLQSVMHEALAKRNDDEEISVNVEVNSDIMRISTNCPPWEVLASFDIETIGHLNLCDEDNSVLGVIVCPPSHEDSAVCHVIKCHDATTIYNTVKKAFKAPNLRSFHLPSPSEPDVYARPGDEDFTSIPHITYLGCVKVKKSYLVINDSISTLLEKLNPKDYKPITLKIRPEEILIVDEETDKTLHQHLIAWVLSLGVFQDDSRLFGYIVTEARQGEKTRMYCHAFRCGRVTGSVTATETIRLACQATYCPGRKDSIRSRCDSTRSSHSSVSSPVSSLERTTTMSSASSVQNISTKSPTEFKSDKFPNRRSTFSSKQFLKKLSPRRQSFPGKGFRSYMSEPDLSRSTSSTSSIEPEPETVEEETYELPPEIEEEREFTFSAAYLCSTVINPPLKPKHVRDCAKQYQKELAKVAKRTGVTPSVKEVALTLNVDGVTMADPKKPSVGQRYFPFPCISDVKEHKDYPEYFAFSTVVTGDTKHKCHLFHAVKEPSSDITSTFELFFWEKV